MQIQKNLWNVQKKAMPDFNTKRTWGPKPNYPKVLAYKAPDHGIITIAGPCSIESEEQIHEVIQQFKDNSSEPTFLRGGPWSYGTFPPDNTGFRRKSFLMFCNIAKDAGIKSIVEVLDIREIDFIARHADAIQIGARHMQDYAMLKEVAQLPMPVTLKRNMGATLDEFLGAAEYLCQGKCRPILIERGSSTYHNHVRWELSVSMIAAIKRLTGIPIIVDGAHSSGRRDLVESLTLAGIAAGADGYLIETHPEPDKSLSDSEQAFPLSEYAVLHSRVKSLHEFIRSGSTRNARRNMEIMPS